MYKANRQVLEGQESFIFEWVMGSRMYTASSSLTITHSFMKSDNCSAPDNTLNGRTDRETGACDVHSWNMYVVKGCHVIFKQASRERERER